MNTLGEQVSQNMLQDNKSQVQIGPCGQAYLGHAGLTVIWMASCSVGFLREGWHAGHLTKDFLVHGNHGCEYCGSILHGTGGSGNVLEVHRSICRPRALGQQSMGSTVAK